MSALAIWRESRPIRANLQMADRPGMKCQFNCREASFGFPIATDSDPFVIRVSWLVYTTYVRL
jgi:hypothetical protein